MASCAHAPHLEFQDSDLRRLIAWFPGAYDLRALSWAHVRVWGAAGRGCHKPASLGSAHFVRSCYVNRALLGISTSAVACGSCQRLPRAEGRSSFCSDAHMCPGQGAQVIRAWEPGYQSAEVAVLKFRVWRVCARCHRNKNRAALRLETGRATCRA